MNIIDLKQELDRQSRDIPDLYTVRADVRRKLVARTRRRTVRALVAVAAAVVILAGGTIVATSIIRSHTPRPAAPDVSAAGIANYACALTDQVLDEVGSSDTLTEAIRDPSNMSADDAAGAVSLLGGMIGAHLKGYDDVSEAANGFFMWSSPSHPADRIGPMRDVRAACGEHGLPQGDPDISRAGQVAFSCALVSDIDSTHGPVDTWNNAPGSGADPALSQLGGVAALLGARTGTELPGYEQFSDAARVIYRGVAHIDDDDLSAGMESLIHACSDGR